MENADAAMAELNGKEFDGRKLMINEARERESRPSGDRDRPPREEGQQ